MDKFDLLALSYKSEDFGDEGCFALPMIRAYGRRPVFRHARPAKEDFDWDRIFSELDHAIIRSSVETTSRLEFPRRHVLIDHGGLVFIQVQRNSLEVFAPEMETADRVSAEFLARYAKQPPPPKPCYHLIARKYGFTTMEVPLDPSRTPDPADLDLLYGEGFSEWLVDFETRLARKNGLSILQGGPGTGKTSCIRLLASRLAATHRFYFIPPLFASAITDPEFIDFWERQRKKHAERQFVCVFEDAEGSLMLRGPDNRNKVEAILNITDGLMSDFLRIQIVCTINCDLTEIDPALLRPGRLLANRSFARLSRPHALRIAEKFGHLLPGDTDDFSLAEIFNGDETPREPARMGFGAP